MIVMDSSKGVAKSVCVKIDFSWLHQINGHDGNHICKFSLVANEHIRTNLFLAVLMLSRYVIDDMSKAEILCNPLMKRWKEHRRQESLDQMTACSYLHRSFAK